MLSERTSSVADLFQQNGLYLQTVLPSALKSCFNPGKSFCNAVRLGVYISLSGYHRAAALPPFRLRLSRRDEATMCQRTYLCIWHQSLRPMGSDIQVIRQNTRSEIFVLLVIIASYFTFSFKHRECQRNRRVKQDIQSVVILTVIQPGYVLLLDRSLVQSDAIGEPNGRLTTL